jgi:membrane protein implicated in regulation of membrane protease activity
MSLRNNILISFDDEVPLLQAVRKLRDNKEIITDVLSPFPVHGLDEALSIKRSRIPVVGFIFGAIGALLAFGFQAWVFTVSYPLIIGGKPFFSVPTFIPITFEVTVLFAGLSMVAAMLIRSKMKPEIRFEPVEERITDDRFVILVEAEDEGTTLSRVRSLLSGIHTIEIR